MPAPARVLVVSAEPVGERMAGPAIRALELAGALARAGSTVTLAAPGDDPIGGLTRVDAGLEDYDALLRAATASDVVVAQLLPPRLLTKVARLPARLAVDLYNPTVVEVLEGTRSKPAASRARIRATVTAAATAHLAAADFVVCASERQRDLWLGGMALRGLLDSDADATTDAAARGLIDVVPFGIGAEPPAGPATLRTELGLPEAARVLVWGGGIWDWLDAPTVIRAMSQLPEDVHLVFLGARRPAMAERDVHAAGAAAVALARDLDLEHRVHFNDGWVPYADRGRWLLGADAGVSAHPDHLETRFAFRTRILDYLWAGLPVVTTRGDALGDRVGRDGLGAAVPAGDPAAFARAVLAVLEDPAPFRERIRAVAPSLTWDRAAAPLAAFCATGAGRPPSRARARALRAATLEQYPAIAREALATDGPAFLARKLGRNLGRAARRR